MATIYVSYSATDAKFVEAVVAKLKARHDVRVDYELPGGVDRQQQLQEDLRSCEVFLVFVSNATALSALQSSEIGAAQFCSRYLDGKLLLPALLDAPERPHQLAHLDCLDVTHRDADQAAEEIERELSARQPRVRLFLSHAHADREVASRLVDVLRENLVVPDGELRCTSVAGYQLDLGTLAPDALRRELSAASCVIALLTPNSIGNEWVLFELGSAWANTKLAIPLLAGGLSDRDIPGPLRGAAGGQLTEPNTIDRMLDQLHRVLGWAERHGLAARTKTYEFVEYLEKHSPGGSVQQELRSSFIAKRARLGHAQGQLVELITKQRNRSYVHLDEIAQQFKLNSTELYYRLEVLRFLGFLAKVPTGERNGTPEYGWTLSHAYRTEIGP